MQDKSSISGAHRLRSRATTDGLDRAPQRAFLRAVGLNDEAIARPWQRRLWVALWRNTLRWSDQLTWVLSPIVVRSTGPTSSILRTWHVS
jgi:hypothetical protein